MGYESEDGRALENSSVDLSRAPVVTLTPAEARLVEALQSGAHVREADFDALLPDDARLMSELSWTPLEVARIASEWLAADRPARILDIGSGAGKFCIVGALCQPHASFVGAEQRPELAATARAVARRLGADNSTFIVGDAFALDWAPFDGFYLFNPFSEVLFERDGGGAELDLPTHFQRFVDSTQERLAHAPAGTRVVVFHGFGGRIPGSYKKRRERSFGRGALELWER